LGVGELSVGGVQVGDAALEAFFTGISRHQEPFFLSWL